MPMVSGITPVQMDVPEEEDPLDPVLLAVLPWPTMLVITNKNIAGWSFPRPFFILYELEQNPAYRGRS